ncbi:hypothetical protein EV356DRAFT_374456 [Viridothelium virens]|uniref:Peptidase S33 tripeptidyl aminopeptidase-like C-terminal domain-containing protein n=1 Tax=Viridothelium virens TaxID=1048519 RepID=A0A6A6GV91_VIRVR|nr:hypothetical protein EV356DRAFT_374456 [Viridothelium virens]
MRRVRPWPDRGTGCMYRRKWPIYSVKVCGIQPPYRIPTESKLLRWRLAYKCALGDAARRMLDTWPPESQVSSGYAGANHSSNPILFVGNTKDSVAPHRRVVKISSQFRGSTVLTVNGTGHSSLNVPPQCVWSHFRAYLVDGTLPPPGTVCQGDKTPFFA